MNTKSIVPLIIVALVVGGIAFYGGIKYQQSKESSRGNRFAQFQGGPSGRQGGNGQPGRFGNGGGMVLGEIIGTDDKSITVKLEDGSSKIILMSDSVTVNKTDAGSKSDLKNGVRVGVFGTANSDGTVTAQNVQLNPMMRMFGRNNVSPSSLPK